MHARNDRQVVVMAKRQRFQSAVALNKEFRNATAVRNSSDIL